MVLDLSIPLEDHIIVDLGWSTHCKSVTNMERVVVGVGGRGDLVPTFDADDKSA